MDGHVQICGIHKSFGETEVLKGIDLDIDPGSFTILLGPSGCGKTTLLRQIAGLDDPTSGDILIDGRSIIADEPKDRPVAMVFQSYALYPHMTAFKNVEYSLKLRKVPKAERKRMVDEVLELVQLSDQADKLPAQMSGGQRQRVALARAIVKRPKVFLMDEPLSNLDAKLRTKMRVELIDLWRELGTTFLYVTHDQVEAMSMGTDIVLMNDGVIMQEGTPRDIYEEPKNLFVAQFIGSPAMGVFPFGEGSIGVRPEEVELISAPDPDRICLPCTVGAVERLGNESVVHLETAFGPLSSRSIKQWEEYGERGYAAIFPKDIYAFDAQGDRLGEADTASQVVALSANV